MTYKQLKEEILSLGFETPLTYTEDANILISAINRSINAIAFEYKPFLKMADVEVLQSVASINLKDIDEGFLKLSKVYKTVKYEKTQSGYEVLDESVEYTDYTQLLNNTIIVYSTGLYTFVYEAKPVQVSVDTKDDEEFNFDIGVSVLLPLLAAYYVFRDDDANKADIYYNDYEMKLASLKMSGYNPTVEVLKGVDI